MSRVKPVKATHWGVDILSERPTWAAKIAQCIGLWAEIETELGLFLALLLHANEKAALTMYSAVENRRAQTRMILSAAEATLPDFHFYVVSALMTAIVAPAMRERDKLAHWCWGKSNELPDALLITEPKNKLVGLMNAVKAQARGSGSEIPFNHSLIYVVREPDLDRTLKQFSDVEQHLREAMGSVWQKNSSQERVGLLAKLESVPAIRAAVQRQARKKRAQEPPKQSRPPGPKRKP